MTTHSDAPFAAATARRDQAESLTDRHKVRRIVSTMATLLVGLVASSGAVSGQRPPAHLNRMIEKLAQGLVVLGGSTSDLSLESARAIATSSLDWIYVDYEHTPMNMETLRTFLVGMVDKAAAVKKGSVQPNVAPLARFAPYAREGSEWAPKQGLDQGLMGVIFNSTETKEQALAAVQLMRYPQRKGSPLPNPVGRRGSGPANALWFWGVSIAEYGEHADLWPLNPQGDLLAMMLIETAEGVKNIDAILSVPGVGAVYMGPGDLSFSLGVGADAPETETAIQTVLKSCQAHGIPCGISASARDMQTRIKQGFKILGAGSVGGGIPAPMDAALNAARAVLK
jgi:4-hydroxy-2-oxoheptanedioate aldolase